MRKICAITGHRADFSRIETILEAVKNHSDLTLQLVVIGAHLSERSGYTVREIERKGFVIDERVETDIPGGTVRAMTESVGRAIEKLPEVIEKLAPDVVIVPTDRFDTLAIGVAAALMNVHAAHIQGGEVTGTIDESIRHALTKMSHLHFVSTEKSRERVIKMGEPEETVFNVGCPATDLLLKMPTLEKGETLKKLGEFQEGGVPLTIDKPYVLMIQHPVTTEVDSAEKQVTETFEALQKLDLQVVALLPNVDAGGEKIREVMREYGQRSSNFHLFSHIPTEIFSNVLRHAACQVGNSSSGVRESCYFGTPVVNIGTRQNSRERGSNVVDVENKQDAIKAAIESQIAHGPYPIEHVYGDGTAGKQIADILATIKLPPIQKKITY